MKILSCVLVILMFPMLLMSLSVKEESMFKVKELGTNNTINHLVINLPDESLASPSVAFSISPADTLRDLESDIELAQFLCECENNMPPFLIKSTLEAGYSLEDLLSAGVTPLTLFKGGISLDSLYGQTYKGGLIFYLDTYTGKGLVSAPTDQSESAEWGCYNNPFSGANGTAIGTGYQNTAEIHSGCKDLKNAGNICFNLVLNGFDDWYLPSKDELYEMFKNIARGASASKNKFGGIDGWIYWSSSRFGDDNAWLMDIRDGSQGNANKGSFLLVRAIRAF